ncbi:MAG: hypothetical protein EOM40_18550 [Clostridia bacterium]|nr:hypothetical protein [Clostridia bacterium]NCC44047.1 hypothetical protein [Clostridia bacterium]
MEHTAEFLATHLAQALHQTDYEKAIYKYQFQVILEQIIGFGIAFVIALCLGKPTEFFTFLAVFMPIRSYGGGYHMDTFKQCLVGSNLLILFILCSVTYVAEYVPVMLLFFQGGAALWVIKKMSPVLHVNRPMNKKEIAICRQKISMIATILGGVMIGLLWMRCRKGLAMIVETLTVEMVLMYAGKRKYEKELMSVYE